MRVMLIHTNLGPYHIARLNSLGKILPGLLVVELASRDKMRAWDVSGETNFACRTLVEGDCFETSSSEINRLLLTELQHFDPDCVVAAGYGHSAFRVAARWARENGKKTVIFSESQSVDRKRGYWKEKLKIFWLKRHVSAVFASGARAAGYMESIGFPKEKIWRGYSVVDNDHFAGQAAIVRHDRERYRERFELPRDYFLYVGRLAEEKNVLCLLRAYKMYRDASSERPWSLVIVGSGPQEKALQTLAAELGLEGVHWVPFRQLDDLPVYYASASAFVLPSTLEPWGLVVNEAMACGLPILASSQCGCVHDLVFPGLNGWVFDPADVAGLAALLGKMQGEDIERMGKASMGLVSTRTKEAWATMLLDCCRSVCDHAD